MTLMDAKAVDAATQTVLDQGIRIFNGALFGADEREHVAVLLEVLDAPEGALVIDAGCGVGEMARLMAEARPDLQFLLVNTSRAQLDLCPPEFDKLEADFERMEALPAACCDAIVFSYAICHADYWAMALDEARRVLKPGGLLLINDMARLSGSNGDFRAILGAEVHEPETVERWAREAGFMLDTAIAPEVQVNRLADLLADDLTGEQIQALLDGVVPTIWRFIALDDEAARWGRHQGCVAFQFSGGRDSTAALYLLRDRWPEMRVYHVDTGDQFPETRAVVAQVEADLAAAGVEMIRITTDVEALRRANGWPSDIVPVDHTAIGRMVSGFELALQGRYDCCASALMAPLHWRMEEDGMTLLVRGQRDDEYAKPPMRDGEHADGFEVHYPLQAWTSDDVMAYLKDNGLPLAPFYEAGMRRAPECMKCTAWLDEGRANYLRNNHPDEHVVLVQRLTDIKRAVTGASLWLTNELEA